MVMQRLHENDLAGHLLAQGGWEHLDLPSIALDDCVIPLGRGKVMTRRVGDILHPERESKDALDRIKAEIGSLQFSAQYHSTKSLRDSGGCGLGLSSAAQRFPG